jgi:SAM-dependent methyltransferase
MWWSRGREVGVVSICGHGGAVHLFPQARSPWEERLMRCQVCGLGFLHPLPTPEQIQGFYPDDYYSFSELRDDPRPFDVRAMCIRGAFGSRWLVDRLAHRLFRGRFGGSRRIERVGEILDVGCGDGYFLSVVREIGWNVRGVELNRAAAARGAERGLRIIAGNLASAGFPGGSFDVIRMSHMLEHSPCPSGEIREAYRLLRPGGWIIIAAPNLASWAARLFKRNWSALDLPRHIFHFSPANLVPLIAEAGFREPHVSSYSVGTTFSSLWRPKVQTGGGMRTGLLRCGLRCACMVFDIVANLAGQGDCFEVQALK